MYALNALQAQAWADLERDLAPASAARAARDRLCRAPEPELIEALCRQAASPPAEAAAIAARAMALAAEVRAHGPRTGVEALLQEFALSSQEGVALMCLAEALLRIPDAPTRDLLIRDKIAGGDWAAHLGGDQSLFVHAAAWGLLVTGRLVASRNARGLGATLGRALARGGEPLVRRAVDLGMRLLGEQFVAGRTIDEALARSRRAEALGFRFSYDMLGEAAMTAADASRHHGAYEAAIHAIGAAAGGRGVHAGPGISIKLSALHPRYQRAQRTRVLGELLPRLQHLAGLARHYDLGLSIDAEEADRLELSLELLEALCAAPELASWSGIGFVVQAYQKRAPLVLEAVIALARQHGRRMMLRLVKGAYWDSEIKRAQLDGMAGYPVYTRKVHTDVAYLACARMLLAAPDAIYPQFATHNAQTVAAIEAFAGSAAGPLAYEFQCLHGMGETLYQPLVRARRDGSPSRACRIYAPVGTHETLLAYLVRRLLENGANTSFVHRIADPGVALATLAADPVQAALALRPPGLPLGGLPLPTELFSPQRRNSPGLDLNSDSVLAALAQAWGRPADGRAPDRRTQPGSAELHGVHRQIRNPARHADSVGTLVEADADDVTPAVHCAVAAGAAWSATTAAERAAIFRAAAEHFVADQAGWLQLLVRESGKTLASAHAELREGIDFLRWYAAQLAAMPALADCPPLGVVVCISPWNFPLAIFVGQVAGALAAGNVVLAKPAEQTPLTALECVRVLHASGVPAGALQCLPGSGPAIGAALIADPQVQGVLFTGSTAVAARIGRALAGRRHPHSGQPVAFIAETGGQNAMIVDSSALPEQVVQDALQSAFDSAGQRCSALRVLCVQQEALPRVLELLLGALAELQVGDPQALACDVGPVIDAAARARLEQHVAALQARGSIVHRCPLPPDCAHGSFVAPTVILIDRLDVLAGETFGPVLHVLGWQRDGLPALLDALHGQGYALTLGIHSRIDETIEQVLRDPPAGNVYVNRNMIGAVVGVQPFGGHGLSGTGPKLGGPLYLRRLLSGPLPPLRVLDALDDAACARRLPRVAAQRGHLAANALQVWREWLMTLGEADLFTRCLELLAQAPTQDAWELRGPTGERNSYHLAPCGQVLCRARTRHGALLQLTAVLASGNLACFDVEPPGAWRAALPSMAGEVLRPAATAHCHHALLEGSPADLDAWCCELAQRPGPLIGIQCLSSQDATTLPVPWRVERLLIEYAVSVNSAAAGGNAQLLMQPDQTA